MTVYNFIFFHTVYFSHPEYSVWHLLVLYNKNGLEQSTPICFVCSCAIFNRYAYCLALY